MERFLSLFLILFFITDVTQEELELNSLQDICEFFMIPTENCTCKDDELRMSLQTDFPELCKDKNKNTRQNATEIIILYNATYSRIYAGITVFVSLIAIAGNFLVIAVAIKNKKYLISYQKLIAQLAFWDFTFAIFQMITCFGLFWTNSWIYGNVMCKLLHGSLTMGSLISVGLIFIITLERYLAVVHPFFWKSGTEKLSLLLSLINISAALISIIPRLIYLHVTPEKQCVETIPNNGDFKYQLFIIIIYFLIPVISMFIMQKYILITLKEKRFTTQSQLDLRTKNINRRVTIILISVLSAFVLFILPNRAVMLYFASVPEAKYNNTVLFVNANKTNTEQIELNTSKTLDNKTYTILTFIALLPYSFHVAINPILYSIIDKTWRKQAVNFIKTSIRRKNINSFVSQNYLTTDGRQRSRSCDSSYRLKPNILLEKETGGDYNRRLRGTSLIASTPKTETAYL